MPRRLWLFHLFAVVLAAACIRLGFWQLSRLGQRRKGNVLVTARLAQPMVALATLPADSTSRLRRAHVAGVPDFDHEIVLAGETNRNNAAFDDRFEQIVKKLSTN